MSRLSQAKASGLVHLVIVTGIYPSPACPTHGTFVRQFAHAVTRQGVECTVIQPVAIHDAIGHSGYPQFALEKVGSSFAVNIYRPRFLSVSARESFRFLGALSPSRLTLHRFTAAVRRVLDQQRIRPDALYGHFLYLSGAAVVQVGQERQIPAFPNVGEGELWTVRRYGFVKAREALAGAAGFLANSSALKRTLFRDLQIAPDRIGVFPNGTDLTRFAPHERMAARHRLGLPQDQFLVGAVGNFLEKKGIVRVGEAIEGLEGVAGVFAGSGPVPPRGSNIALCRRFLPDDIPYLLSACDVFVLPTVIEGSCNALVEAMACGLPVISSKGEFNDDILDDSMSIRVDPLDVQAIRQAILMVMNDPVRRAAMADAALRRSRAFDINDRARRMLAFMADRCSQHRCPVFPADP